MNAHNTTLLSGTALTSQADLGFASTSPSSIPSFVGMRIARVELRNFGTYDGPATSFDFDTYGAVMAGGNGMGKSTAFDAIKVAFVTNPELNNAAGEKGDRSIVSYYRGAHGDKETDSGSEEECLRSLGDPETTMGILVEFQNAEGRVLTAIRLLYIDRAGVRTWRYVVGHKRLSLDRDFPRIEGEKTMRDRGIANGYGIYGSFDKFMKALAEGLGMESSEQAKRAFRLQSIATGLPQMKSTTDFARDFILPPANFLVDVAKAATSIDQHREIRDKITQSEKQLEDLTDICGALDQLEKEFAARASLMRADAQIDVVREYAQVMQARQRLRMHMGALNKSTTELDTLQASIRQQNDRLEELKQKIEAADGNKIDGLENQLSTARETQRSRSDTRTSILDAVTDAGLHRGFRAEKRDWDEIPAAITRKEGEIAKQKADIQIELDEATTLKVRANDAVQKLKNKIADTESNRSAMPEDLRKARSRIAEALQISEETIPFIGELLQVSNAHVETWELAANKLLGGPALNILVPDVYFKAAEAQLPNIRKVMKLKACVRLQRVSDIDVCDDARASALSRIDRFSPDAIARKIDVKDEHPLAPYVMDLLAKQGDLVCCDDNSFGTKTGRRISPSGAMSTRNDRAEIDTRDTAMVLGWSVDRLLERLRSDLKTAETSLNAIAATKGQCEAGLNAMNAQQAAVSYLSRILKPWSEVDTADQESRILRLETDIAAIQTTAMSQMRAERKDVEAALKSGLSREKEVEKEKTTRETQIASEKLRVVEGFQRISLLRSADPALLNRSDYAGLRARLVTLLTGQRSSGAVVASSNIYDRIFPAGMSDIPQAFDKLRRSNATEVVNAGKRISSQGTKLEFKIDAYFKKNGDERDLPLGVRANDQAGADARFEWRDRKDRVARQELPKAQAAAAEFRKTSLHQQVLTLSNTLATYDKEARSLADGINKIMGSNVFNPATGSYARLKITRSANPYVRELETLISDALDGYTDRSDEDVFERITKIADYLKDDGTPQQRKRRDEIAHLANRFDAEVHEMRQEADGTMKLTRRIAGSGKLSGGEKDRLSTFLLASAMKCAFNAHDEFSEADALHTILVDEAFGRSTDENASAQISVLDSFGLQVIAATPMSKIRPFQPVIGSVFIVSRPTNLQTGVVRLDIDEIDLSAYEKVDEVPDFSAMESA